MTFEVSVVIPCLDEEKTIARVVEKAQDTFRKNRITGEVVVCDNGSKDKSVSLAKKAGARVVFQKEKGYGAALHKAIQESRGKYILMLDADDTYDVRELPKFLAKMRSGAEFVIGDRLGGKIVKDAMPWTHRYIGTPVLSTLIYIMFGTRIRDNNCGMRMFTRDVYEKLDMHTTGMEYASEMIIKAAEKHLKIEQVSITLTPRAPGSEAKLRTFQDGWRHLRFMLLYSPLWLFMVPGITLLILGAVLLAALTLGPLHISNYVFGTQQIILGSMLVIIGYQIITLGVYTKFYRISDKFEKGEETLMKMHRFITLERGVVIGLCVLIAGIVLDAVIFFNWYATGQNQGIHMTITALTLVVVGLQTIFSSFFLSIIRIPKRL